MKLFTITPELHTVIRNLYNIYHIEEEIDLQIGIKKGWMELNIPFKLNIPKLCRLQHELLMLKEQTESLSFYKEGYHIWSKYLKQISDCEHMDKNYPLFFHWTWNNSWVVSHAVPHALMGMPIPAITEELFLDDNLNYCGSEFVTNGGIRLSLFYVLKFKNGSLATIRSVKKEGITAGYEAFATVI